MLADLGTTGCPPMAGYQSYINLTKPFAQQWKKVLESAKKNLAEMNYFGLTEYQALSAELFEWTFNLTFKDSFTQQKDIKAKQTNITTTMKHILNAVTQFENELYVYARDLFRQRVMFMRKEKAQLKAENKQQGVEPCNCGHIGKSVGNNDL